MTPYCNVNKVTLCQTRFVLRRTTIDGYISSVCYQPFKPTQPSTISWLRSEYWPRCSGRTLWLEGSHMSGILSYWPCFINSVIYPPKRSMASEMEISVPTLWTNSLMNMHRLLVAYQTVSGKLKKTSCCQTPCLSQLTDHYLTS